MTCNVCGGNLREVVGERAVHFPSRTVTIQARYFQCDRCAEILLTSSQADEARSVASSLVRAREGLLQGEEIRTIRKNLRLRQREFEQLLGVGRNTVARWEAGTVFQSKAVDSLLRMVRDVPHASSFLAARNNVPLAVPPVFAPQPMIFNYNTISLVYDPESSSAGKLSFTAPLVRGSVPTDDRTPNSSRQVN